MRRLATVGILAGILGAGCSSGASAPQPLPPIDPATFSAAADAIHEATRRYLRSSAKVLTTVTVTNATKRYTITIRGGYDMRSERGRLTVVLPGGGIDRVHVVFTRSEVYVDRLANLPEGAWAVSPRDRVKTHYLLRTPANDPGAVVKQVAEIQRPLLIGEENLRAVATKHYRGWLGWKTLTKYLAADKLDAANQVIDALGTDGVPADVWIDDRGQIVRILLAFTAGGVTSKLQLDLSDHGSPVRVRAPSPDYEVPEGGFSGVLLG
ncbi:MAG: hypothetical protein ACRDGJ_12310 [Candidatus Limnocylindria bacterium]